MNNFKGLFCLALFFVSTSSLSAHIQFQEWSLAQARQAASESDKLFFLYFTADWCMPCRWMEDHTFQEDALNAYVKQHYLAVKVDFNKGHAARLRDQFSVSSIPSILVFNASGQLIDRQEGSMDAQPLLRWLKRLDRPANHLRPAKKQQASEATLHSPQAKVEFVQPALGAAPNMLAQQANTAPRQGELLLPDAPLAMQSNTDEFQARAPQYYTVQLKYPLLSYPQAIQLVQQLEQKFKQPIELAPQADGKQAIIIGQFERRSAAQNFLYYLNRNNWEGSIIPLIRKP